MGGYFNYKQIYINDIISDIEEELEKQGREIPKEELYGDEELSEEKVYYTHPEIVQEKMKETIKFLKIAAVYVGRVDWYLSGDGSEKDFVKKLLEDLNSLE